LRSAPNAKKKFMMAAAAASKVSPLWSPAVKRHTSCCAAGLGLAASLAMVSPGAVRQATVPMDRKPVSFGSDCTYVSIHFGLESATGRSVNRGLWRW